MISFNYRYKITGETKLPLLQQTNADVYLVIMFFFVVLMVVIGGAAVQLSPVIFKKYKAKAE